MDPAPAPQHWFYRYIFGLVRQEELAAFYRDATIGLITPLRDGMNLVAKV
jgi:trehalose 6-phosphate synthase/phosphatase